MKAVILFRIAAVVMLLFAAGHTFGFLTFQPPTTEGLAVLSAMDNVHFQVGRSTYSYGHFYRGFGLSITASQLFAAYLAWYFGTLARRGHLEILRALSWPFIAWQITGLILSWIYFGAGPVIFSLLVMFCLIAATLLAKKDTALQEQPS